MGGRVGLGWGRGWGLQAAGGGGGDRLAVAWKESRTQASWEKAGGCVEKANRCLLFFPMESFSTASLGCHLERDITLRVPSHCQSCRDSQTEASMGGEQGRRHDPFPISPAKLGIPWETLPCPLLGFCAEGVGGQRGWMTLASASGWSGWGRSR